MPGWFGYALGAAVLYGAHQLFTKLAAEHIADGLGAFVVESSAVLTIAVYLAWLYLTGPWTQSATPTGLLYAALTGVCVGAGTIVFFLLFQNGAPLTAVPGILAAGSAIMALLALAVLGEPISLQRALGIAFSILGLYLVR